MDEQLLCTIRQQVHDVADFVVATRRDIHAHPELGNQEQRTPALIAAEAFGATAEVAYVSGSGVLAAVALDYLKPPR